MLYTLGLIMAFIRIGDKTYDYAYFEDVLKPLYIKQMRIEHEQKG